MEEMNRKQLQQNAELAQAQRDLLVAKAAVKTTKKELTKAQRSLEAQHSTVAASTSTS